jgi:sialic acid synthase SpsE
MIPTLQDPPYIIAEIGANHNGDMTLAEKLITTAAECGASAVKFQSWDTTIFSRQVYEQNFFLGDDYRNRADFDLKEIVQEFSIDKEQLKDLSACCKDASIDFSSTPFNVEQLDDLIELGVPYIKIASMDLNNPLLLDAAGRSGLPVVLSTGFGSMAEIDTAVERLERAGVHELAILHCVSLYPPADGEVNLRNIPMLQSCFGYPTGFSDHTVGTAIPLAAIALGACVLEKHFTLDKSMFGWDHKVSADPDEMREICVGAARVHTALGAPRRKVGERELERRDEYRRSIVSIKALSAGHTLSEEDIDFRRPGTGIAPPELERVIGRKVQTDLPEDTLIDWSHLSAL